MCAALQMAICSRCPSSRLMVHSDRGCQYASAEHAALLSRHGLVASMSKKGNCWDIAVMERFFPESEDGAVWHSDYANHDEAKRDASDGPPHACSTSSSPVSNAAAQGHMICSSLHLGRASSHPNPSMSCRDPALAARLLDILFDEPGVGRCLLGVDDTVLRVNADCFPRTAYSLGQESRQLFWACCIWLPASSRGALPVY